MGSWHATQQSCAWGMSRWIWFLTVTSDHMAMDKHSAFLSTDVCAVKLPVPPLECLIASRQNVFFVPLQKQIAPCVFPQRATKSSEGRASRVSDCILNTVHNALNKQHRLESGIDWLKLMFVWEKDQMSSVGIYCKLPTLMEHLIVSWKDSNPR